MVNGSEKREAHRAPLGAKISWTMDGRQWKEDDSQDVSSTGMMLRTQERIDPGTPLRLHFKLPNQHCNDPIMPHAEVMRVVRRQDRQVGVGLRFLMLRSRDHRVVHEFVCRILGLSSDDVIDVQEEDAIDRLLLQGDERSMRLADQKLAQETARLHKEKIHKWIGRTKRVALLMLLLFLALKVRDGYAKAHDILLLLGR